MSSRRLLQPAGGGDDGRADPALVRALAACAADPGLRPDVLAALHATRVLTPMVAVADGTTRGAGGRTREKAADVVVPLLEGVDGRRALPVFSGTDAMARWDAAARPVPLTGVDAARVALDEDAPVLVVDVADPHACVLETTELRGLAAGLGAVPAYRDPAFAAAVERVLDGEPDVVAGRLAPHPGVDARLWTAVRTGLGADAAAAVLHRVRDRLRQEDALPAAVRGIDLALDPGDH